MTVTVSRVLAPNPSVYTGDGTNTWIIESGGRVLVVDPGPVIDAHLEAIHAGIGDRAVAGVLVTHTHRDHAPLANPLGRELGVEVSGYAPGPGFEPDRRLADGDTLRFGDATLTVLHTPGHSRDHLCFLVGSELFTGDHIMGGSTVMVEDLSAYLAGLRRLRDLTLTRLYPGHGPIIEDPERVVDHYIAHRLERERQIVSALVAGHDRIGDVVRAVYADVDPELHPLAAASVAAHVRKLVEDGTVRFEQTGDVWHGIVTLIDR